MHKKACLIGVILTLTLNAFASNIIEEKIKKHRLKPLQESTYWKEHPNQLPYEKCKLYKHSKKYNSSWNFSLIFHKFSHWNYYELFCYSKKLQTAFIIPVSTSAPSSQDPSPHTLGSLPLGVHYQVSKTELKKLDGHSLHKIFGKYRGFETSFGLGVDAGTIHLRKDGIQLQTHHIGATLVELTMGYSFSYLRPEGTFQNRIFSKFFRKRIQIVLEKDYKNEKLKKNLLRLRHADDVEKYTPLASYYKVPYLSGTESFETCFSNLESFLKKHDTHYDWIYKKTRCLDPMFGRMSKQWLKTLKFKKIQ